MLFVHSSLLAAGPHPITARDLPRRGFYFSSPAPQALTLAGAGQAWSYGGNSDLGRAGAAWHVVAGGAAVEDRVRHRGSGLVAFASFGFDPETPGVLTVPTWTFGADDTCTWLTVAYQAQRCDPEEVSRLRSLALAWLQGTQVEEGTPVAGETAVWGRVVKGGLGGVEEGVPVAGEVRPEDALRVVELPVELVAAQYRENVAAAVEAIRRGEAEKIVMARPQRWNWAQPLSPATRRTALLERLGQRYPTCWQFSVAGLVGATPEMLMEATDGVAHSRVLAGTASPGEGIDLMASAKNLQEHHVAVASVTQALEEVGVPLRCEGPGLLRLPNVEHLATDITLPVPTGKTLLYLVGRIHPTAAVGGLPRAAATSFIRQLESRTWGSGFDGVQAWQTAGRGRYAGPVGWVDAQGGGQLALALRCAQLDQAGLTAWVGAGIMPDSDPTDEYLETCAKLSPIRDALDQQPQPLTY